METIIHIAEQLNVNTLLVVVAGAVLIWKQFRNDASKVSAEVISAYKLQVAQYKEEVKGYGDKLNELNHKIGTQDGIIAEKDKQLKSYESILQNRNPELEKILVQVVSFMQKLDDRMEFSESELKKQTKMLKLKA